MSFHLLRERFPLAEQWEEPTVFLETAAVGDVAIHLAGICTRNVAGDAVTGSAGALSGSPLDRAYFELLERTSIVTMCASNEALPARHASGEPSEPVPRDLVAPTGRDPCRWIIAKSNGVAAGPTWQEACNRAQWELIERDRVLRSWYGELPCTSVEISQAMVPAPLSSLYSFEAYQFGDAASSNVDVVGIFGFPRREEAPMLCGFGARPTLEQALAVAASECIQRLGFLWGEEIPNAEPTFSPTPDFHQEFFLWPGAHERLRRWLAGGHSGAIASLIGAEPRPVADRPFVDMTPAELKERLFVAKAIPAGEIPLVFGDGHPDIAEPLPEDLRFHPIS